MSNEKRPESPARVPISKALLSELIAQTPGAQTREQAVKSINARREKRLAKIPQPAICEDHLAEPEPLPIIEKPDEYATEFFQRLKAKEKRKEKPTKRSKPRLIVDNDKPDLSSKT